MSDKSIILLLILLVVVGLVGGIGGVFYFSSPKPIPLGISNPQNAPVVTEKSDSVKNAVPPTPMVPLVSPELEQLRQQNTELREKIDQLNLQLAKQKEMAASLPPAPKIVVPDGVLVSGAAYVVRQNGQSDILRGFHVNLIQSTVPPRVLQAALTTVAQNFKAKAVESRATAAKMRKDTPQYAGMEYDPGKYYEEDAIKAEKELAEFTALIARVNTPTDSAAALRALEKTNFVNVIRDLVAKITIAATTTDVQGVYKFTNVPAGSYVFAMFDTTDGFLMWAVPVNGAGSIDLFNDTAFK